MPHTLPGESYASLYRKAVREARRAELAQALGEIERATHAVVGRWDHKRVYCYGSGATCVDFSDGIERDVSVVAMTSELKEILSVGKIQAYRGCK